MCPPGPGKAKALGSGRVLGGTMGCCPPHARCRGWQRPRGSLLPGGDGTGGARGSTWAPPSTAKVPVSRAPSPRGAPRCRVRSGPEGGPKGNCPPPPGWCSRRVPGGEAGARGASSVHPPVPPSMAHIWGGGGHFCLPPHQCPTRVPALCPGGGGEGGAVMLRGGCAWGGGRPRGGRAPPRSVHHVTTRLTLDTDTNAGCAPPPPTPPRRTPPPRCLCPQGQVGGHQDAGRGSRLLPGREGVGGTGQGWGERGPPPKSLRFEGGLSRVGIFQSLQLGLQFGDLKNSKGDRSQRGGAGAWGWVGGTGTGVGTRGRGHVETGWGT